MPFVSRTFHGHSPAFTDLDVLAKLEIPVSPVRREFALAYL